ncbi:hypothetical protein [Pseudoalteromonas luteoviolacea]|jgi:hypothetical protein|uniref:hypothetical protein n=1 Tax=Pseudoalteromonas luteoviolacea TaxID=43657 RepID=UPI001B38C8C8|nr:hypothetical protein [Pseudoalteromonas luteoviolacea]MBQ4840168.1 hypothetical protein [Pseudoalteromonas luteoviolacea]
MGSITKSSTGLVAVSYNKASLSEVDEQVFKYAVASFSHLVQRNQKLCFAQFGELVQQHYVAEGKTKLCLEAIEKAAINHRYVCSFEYRNPVSDSIESADAVIEVEQWYQVKPALERQVNTQVTSLEFKGVSCVYRKGSFSYDAKRQEVKL